MKKFFKIFSASLGILLGIIILFILAIFIWISVSGNRTAKRNLALAGPEIKTLTVDGFTFRDLNKNGRLDIYEDKRKSFDERINGLLSQMNLEEKAGLMFIPPVSMKKDGSISEKPSLNPAVIPEIAAASKGLLADFGASDEALLDVIFGKINPSAKLPFEMPSSMEAVRKQKEDMPYDSENPLFPFGFGLSY
jgi:Glycosyl hydrolase family 3 C-terminal domain